MIIFIILIVLCVKRWEMLLVISEILKVPSLLYILRCFQSTAQNILITTEKNLQILKEAVTSKYLAFVL